MPATVRGVGLPRISLTPIWSGTSAVIPTARREEGDILSPRHIQGDLERAFLRPLPIVIPPVVTQPLIELERTTITTPKLARPFPGIAAVILERRRAFVWVPIAIRLRREPTINIADRCNS